MALHCISILAEAKNFVGVTENFLQRLWIEVHCTQVPIYSLRTPSHLAYFPLQKSVLAGNHKI